MRFARGDMWGYIVLHKNHHGASHRLYGVLQWRSRPKIDFCEVLGSGRYSTFATKYAKRRHHSMTSVACARSVFGTVRPSAFAVLRLMTRSNLVGRITGKSAGLAPWRILPV